ncbi:MAG: glycosyltransferase [Gemmataceae bacterium]
MVGRSDRAGRRLDRSDSGGRGRDRQEGRPRAGGIRELPPGWNGKHACFALSKLARYPLLCFLDADVRLTPDALARLLAFRARNGAALVSGFPRQETGTLLEKLLIPLINWLLVGYLPMPGMRFSRWAAFGAGCGQWFLTDRDSYATVGGHAAVKSSRHDGLTLPRAYRREGFHTDVCDASRVAACRMYRDAAGVWFGLSKNAREGMATASQLPVWTVLLAGGHVLPWLVAPVEPLAWVAVGLSVGLRLATAVWFRASLVGAVLHPVGVILLLALQWTAALGRPVGWKGRPAVASHSDVA